MSAVRVFPKSPLVTLSEAKGLCAGDRILRFAQNDRRYDSDLGKALGSRRRSSSGHSLRLKAAVTGIRGVGIIRVAAIIRGVKGRYGGSSPDCAEGLRPAGYDGLSADKLL